MRKIIFLTMTHWIFSASAMNNTLSESDAYKILKHQAPIQAMMMSPVKPELVSATTENPAKSYRWDLKTNNGLITNRSEPIDKLTILPDGTNYPINKNVIQFPTFGIAPIPNGDVIIGNANANYIFKINVNGEKNIEKLFDCYSCQYDLAISPNGKYVLTGSDDQLTRLWSLNSGEKELIFEHNGAIRAVAISPDGRQFLTGSNDKTAALWTWSDGSSTAQLLNTFRHSNPVTAVAFLPDGSGVITVSNNTAITSNQEGSTYLSFGGKAYLWRGGKLDTKFQFQQPITHMSISPITEQVAFASGKNIFLFNLFTFHDDPQKSADKEWLTHTEVGTMARLGVKIRYENEAALRPLTQADSPVKVIQATELDMSDLFLDELPPWLGKFTKLRYLNLSKNKLTLKKMGVLRSLTQLEKLDLSDNPIFSDNTIGAGNFFKPLEDLLKINLSNTKLSDTDWGTLGFPQLIEMDLSKNQLTRINIESSSRLKGLDLSHNKITSLKLNNLPSLEYLDISFNQLTALDLSRMPSQIVELNANNNNIRSIKFNRDHDLPFLQKLTLGNNNSLKELPTSMEATFSLQNLKVLVINSDVVIPEGLRRKIESYQKKP